MRQETTRETDARDRAGQARGPAGRTRAVRGQWSGHLVVACALGTQPTDLVRPLVRARQVGEGSNRHGDLARRGLAPAPHDAGVHLIAPRPLDHHLVDETTQEDLTLGLRQHVSGPECRQVLPNALAALAAARWLAVCWPERAASRRLRPA